MLRIINKCVSMKWHVCHAPDKPANQDVSFDVISNIMTFLMLRIKVKTVYSISMNNGDKLINFAG